jgi:hypothetical protein
VKERVKWIYERESKISLIVCLKQQGGKKPIGWIRFMPQFGLQLVLAEWTQIRYLQTASLPALKDPDPHNGSTKGRANT